MKPLLAHTYEPHRVTYPCYVQPKLNGVRALYQNGRFLSRDQVPFPVGLLDHLAKPLLEQFGTDHPPLDGELYVHGWPLQKILGAITPVRQKPTGETLQVEYHIFDVVDFDHSFEKRMVESSVVTQGTHIFRVPSYWVQENSTADRHYAAFVDSGYEGMMYRLGHCPYTKPKQQAHTLHGTPTWHVRSRFLSDKNNRCWHLLKRKDWKDDEFKIVSFNLTIGEKGEEGFQLGCLTPSGKPFFVGTGLTAQERQFYFDNSPVGLRAKVKYLVLSQDGIPLNPTLLAILK